MSTTMEPLTEDRGGKEPDSREVDVVPRFQRLHSASPLRFDRSSCLPLQFPYLTCERCADACPAAVLHRDDNALRLDDGCLRCGRCAAVCPTGALCAIGFESGTPARGPLYVDCWKVPPEKSPAGTVRVPCVAGLAQSQWLALAASSNGHAVLALDRGWCAHCSAGSRDTHPAADALAAARSLLGAVYLSDEALPRLEPRLLPRRHMPRAIPPADAVKARARRSPRAPARRRFLQGLAREVTSAAVKIHEGEPTPAAKSQRARRPGTLRARERERQLEWVVLLARRRAAALPAQFLPSIAVGDGCRNHRICAALCPTGALRPYEAEGESGVVFDAYQCIACGHCARACPEQALRFAASGATARAGTRLTHHRSSECHECGARFSAITDGEVCPSCRKSRDAFAVFFGAGPQRATVPAEGIPEHERHLGEQI